MAQVKAKARTKKINTKQPLIKVCTKLATNNIHTYLYTNTSVCIFFVLVLFEGIKIQNNQPQAFNNITKQITERSLDYTIAGFKLIYMPTCKYVWWNFPFMASKQSFCTHRRRYPFTQRLNRFLWQIKKAFQIKMLKEI